MVSYFPTTYSKSNGSNLPYPTPPYPPPWYSNYPINSQMLSESDISQHQAMYYPSHLFQSNLDFQIPQHVLPPPDSGAGLLNPDQRVHSNNRLSEGLQSIPSPTVTVSGSESSPGIINESASPLSSTRSTLVKSPFEWMIKRSHQPKTGITRTKDKYRIVYSDYQRLELEKEYSMARYISVSRKLELAHSLRLSERQVKIWFQNRRAKERKTKRRVLEDAPSIYQSVISDNPITEITNLDIKPEIDPGLSQHSMHHMNMGLDSQMHSQHFGTLPFPQIPPPIHHGMNQTVEA